MRAGKSVLERQLSSMTKEMREDSIVLSLDVSGWSPNAPREVEMSFCDMLSEFFKVPH